MSRHGLAEGGGITSGLELKAVREFRCALGIGFESREQENAPVHAVAIASPLYGEVVQKIGGLDWRLDECSFIRSGAAHGLCA